MNESAFAHAALALAIGMGAQALAAGLAIPSIVVLLVAGALVGPDVLGLLDPSAFGGGRIDLVNLAVTVILFEGALALDLGRLRQQQRSLVLLLTLGAAISMAIGTLAAAYLLDLPWSIAALYGALMIVTGPTVVTPLLARLTVDREVRELLVSEGVLIDPIGAIVAIVAADWVVGHHGSVVTSVAWTLALGAVIGVAAGLALAVVLRRGWIAEELVNAFVLAIVLATSAVASRLSPEAGLMAAVAMGVTLANSGLRGLGRLREFKETLTTILLSFMFVVLAADLPLAAVWDLGWPAVGVVAIVAWVARPLAVACATVGSGLTLRQRLFVAWICPRGIVAAAVAGLFRLRLGEAGMEGGTTLEALVFVTIALTVSVQGLTARRVAHALHVDVPSVVGTIVLGANPLGVLLARLFTALDCQVAVIDRSPIFCRRARKYGLSVYEGDALSVDTLEEAGARYADTLVAVTTNHELNALVAQRVKENFQSERVLPLTEDAEDAAEGRHGPLPGTFPGIDETNRMLRLGHLRLIEYEVAESTLEGETLGTLPYAPNEFALLVQRGARVLIATDAQKLAVGDRLWTARARDGASPLGERLTVTMERDARTLEPIVAPEKPAE